MDLGGVVGLGGLGELCVLDGLGRRPVIGRGCRVTNLAFRGGLCSARYPPISGQRNCLCS